jgi:heme exporter protein A
MPGDKAIFRGDRLACERGGRLVFARLGFSLAAGEMLVLRGANGSGKSTLLRVMAGLTPVLSGEIRWGEGAIRADRIAHNSRCHYVSHQDALKPMLTVRQNLELWQSLRNGSPERIELALERLGIARLADLPARLLSAGQRRLALARLVAILRRCGCWMNQRRRWTPMVRPGSTVTSRSPGGRWPRGAVQPWRGGGQ